MAAATPKVYGVVPAAGASRRMGTAKQLLPWGDSNIVRTVVDAIAAGGVDGLVLVTNPTVAEALSAEFSATHNVVVLDDPKAEMIDSIIAGVLALRTVYSPNDDDAFLVCPGDLPRMSAGLVQRCVAAYRACPRQPVAPVTGERPRHPLIVPFALADDLEGLHGVGLQGLFTRNGVHLHTITADDPALVEDVDTLEEYAALRKRGT